MTLAPGSTVGPYRIIEPLGRGGMASVQKAYDAALDRYVALKVLPAEFLHDPTFAGRFHREAKVIASLEHSNIVPVYSYGIENGIPWMCMRLVSGGALSGLLAKGPLPLTRIVGLLRGVADALDHAHAAGVVHRDVKPQNILLDKAGKVYLADFGIARMAEGATVLTQAGMIVGTPEYMAPEQARAEMVDHRCDIYALGIIAYQMFVGRVPFTADTPVAILMKHLMEPLPIPPPDLVPEPVTRVVLKALAKAPADRWSRASDFVDALAQAAQIVTAGMPSPGEMPTADLPPTDSATTGDVIALHRAASTSAMPDRPSEPLRTPCPFCAEPVLGGARICPHCREILDPSLRRPSVREELARESALESLNSKVEWTVALTIGLAVVPCVDLLFGLGAILLARNYARRYRELGLAPPLKVAVITWSAYASVLIGALVLVVITRQ